MSLTRIFAEAVVAPKVKPVSSVATTLEGRPVTVSASTKMDLPVQANMTSKKQ